MLLGWIISILTRLNNRGQSSEPFDPHTFRTSRSEEKSPSPSKMFSLNNHSLHVVKHKEAKFDVKEGDKIVFTDKKEVLTKGKIIKRQGIRIRVELEDGSTVWSEIKEVTSVEGGGHAHHSHHDLPDDALKAAEEAAAKHKADEEAKAKEAAAEAQAKALEAQKAAEKEAAEAKAAAEIAAEAEVAAKAAAEKEAAEAKVMLMMMMMKGRLASPRLNARWISRNYRALGTPSPFLLRFASLATSHTFCVTTSVSSTGRRGGRSRCQG